MKNPYGDEIEFSAKADDSQIQLAIVDDGTLRVTLEGECPEGISNECTISYHLTLEEENEMFQVMLKRRMERGSPTIEEKVTFLKELVDDLDIIIKGAYSSATHLSSEQVVLATSSDEWYTIVAGQTVVIQTNLC